MTILFCLSHAGGTATTVYESWRTALAPEHQVVPIDYPGRGVRSGESAALSTETLLDDVLRVIERQLAPGRPWALFGHSMGAMVAREIALRAQNHPTLGVPQTVFVSGRRPPRDAPVAPLGARSVDDLVEAVTSWGGIPPDIAARPHLARPLLRDLLHDLPLSHDLPGSARTLPCPLHVLWSDDDPLTRDDRIGHWALASRATVTFHRFTGDHFFLGTGAHRAIPIVQDALRASHHGGDSSEDAAQQPGKALLEHGRAQ